MNVWGLQLVRFVVVGVLSNVLVYGLYLLLTALGIGPKVAMSVSYAMGVVQTYFVQRRWTFTHGGEMGRAFRRYLLAYVFVFVGNLAVLQICVDELHWPHQIVQAAAICGFALILFLLQKVWVFRGGDKLDACEGVEP